MHAYTHLFPRTLARVREGEPGRVNALEAVAAGSSLHPGPVSRVQGRARKGLAGMRTLSWGDGPSGCPPVFARLARDSP
jgi:hypothetical protein